MGHKVKWSLLDYYLTCWMHSKRKYAAHLVVFRLRFCYKNVSKNKSKTTWPNYKLANIETVYAVSWPTTSLGTPVHVLIHASDMAFALDMNEEKSYWSQLLCIILWYGCWCRTGWLKYSSQKLLIFSLWKNQTSSVWHLKCETLEWYLHDFMHCARYSLIFTLWIT